MPERKSCSVEGCPNPRHARGFCNTHYRRLLATGSPRAEEPTRLLAKTAKESFLNRTEQQGECLVWTGARDPRGYGQITVNGRVEMAHRYAWSRRNGPIPDGKVVDHRCWNPSCVKAEHLRVADQSQNTAYQDEVRSATGVKSVYKRSRGYEVSVKNDGKVTYFGTYPTLSEAAEVSRKVRQEIYGEYAGRQEREAV